MLIVILLARFLSVEDFGKLTFALSYAVIIAIVAEGGTHFVFLREIAASPERGAIWKEFLGLKLALAAAAWVGAAVLALLLWPWGDIRIPLAVTGYVLGNSVVDFFHQACNAAERFGASAAVTGSHRAVCLLLSLAALGAGGGLTGATGALCVGSLLGAAIGYAILKVRLDFVSFPSWQPEAWIRRIRESLPLALASGFFMTTTRVGVLVLAWLGLTREAGFYGAAQRLFDAGNMIPAALMTVALPRFSRTLAQAPALLAKEVRQTGLLVAGTAAAMLALGEALAGPVISIFFGARYAEAVPILRWMIAANALIMVNYFFVTLLLLHRRQQRHSLNEALTLAAAAALTIAWASRHGAIGAASALVAAQGFLFILTLWAVRPHWPAAETARA